MTSPASRYRGCLLGLAVGDALGAPIEFHPPGTFEPVTGMKGGGVCGEITVANNPFLFDNEIVTIVTKNDSIVTLFKRKIKFKKLFSIVPLLHLQRSFLHYRLRLCMLLWSYRIH